MDTPKPSPHYDREDRTFRFAQAVRALIRQLPRTGNNPPLATERLSLVQEAVELLSIFGAILRASE